MKEFLLALMLLMPMMMGCGRRPATERELTAVELDSIRHAQINDSINRLDTIRVLSTLFMGMSPSQYDTLVYRASKFVKIGDIVFDSVDTLLYHDVVHDVNLKGRFHQDYIVDIDEMARSIKKGERTYSDVISSLSSKYGPPSYKSKLSELSDNGFQMGSASWNFDKFSIEYEQKQWARLSNMTFDVEGKISYSIPRIQTPEEKHHTDSVVSAWERERNAEELRNQKAIQSL